MRLNTVTFPCALLVLLLPLGGALIALGAPPGPVAGFHPVLVVEAAYPGADARTVAESVAAPIEQQVNGVEHLVHMASRCTNEGRYTLLLSFDSGTDLNVAQVLVQNRVNLALPVLPEAVKQAGVTFRKVSPGAILVVVLTSPGNKRDAIYLGNYASIQIKDELVRLAGVADISLLGGEEYGVRILLDPDKLAARKLTPNDVLDALREQNAKVAGGQIGQPPVPAGQIRELRLSTIGRLTDADSIGDIIVKSVPDGGIVRVRDVARVEVGRGTSRGDVSYDGQPAVALAISLLPTAKPRDVAAAVRGKMEGLKKSFTDGIDYTVALDLTPKSIVGRATVSASLLAEPILPDGSSAERMRKCQALCSEILKKTAGVQHTLELSENPFAFFRGGPCVVAVLDSDTKDEARVLGTARQRLTKEVPYAMLRLRDLSGSAGVRLDGYPLDFALRGPDAAAIREFGETVSERLSRSDKLTDVAAGARTTPQLVIDVDRTKCAALGVSLNDVFSALQVYLDSYYVNDFNKFGRTWQVQVESRSRDKIKDVKQLKVRGAKGEMVPLSTVVTVREASGPTQVDRFDMRPAARVSGSPAFGVSPAEARWLCETVAEQVRKELRLPEAYGLVWLQEVPTPKPMPGEPKAGPEPPPPEVTVAQPVAQEVTDYEDFTGRIEAAQRVDLRARVTGYLEKALFKDGADVKKGDALFVIDPRPYQAALDQAQAQLKVAEAQRELSKRAVDRLRAGGAGVTPAEFDAATDAYRIAVAQLEAAKATVEIARLNLDYTTIGAPIDGRIGRHLVDAGNLVKGDDTILATLVSLDPVNVYFDLDERTFLRLERLGRQGKAKSLNETDLPVSVGLADETDFPHRGTVNFVDNHVNPDTGTVTIRAVLANSEGLLKSGLFARVRLPIGAPHKALLVPEEAIHSDRGQKVVYVVDDGNKVVSRAVIVGAKHDGQRVIDSGLRPEDRVIVESRGRVRPGQIVKPMTVKP